MRNDLGGRLRHIRASRNQQEMADEMGVAKRTYASYERNERIPDATMLVPLILEGWDGNWLLTGAGAERRNALQDKDSGGNEAVPSASQPMRSEDLTLAIQLAEEALDGKRLEPADYAQLVTLIHSALVNGLPSAQVLAFARPASRGLRGKDDGSAVGGSGQGAAGAR